MECELMSSRSSHQGLGLTRGVSARGSAQVAVCSRRVSHIVCGSKKKKAEKRVKDGRKRLADVIQELQTSTSVDRDNLQSRLQEIDTVLCGECESSTSSSSSSSEDECEAAEMGNAISAQSTLGEASNVVPMPAKVKADKVLKREAPISVAEVVRGLPEGAAVRVCDGKACRKKGSAGLMAALQESGACGDSIVACKCLDKCKLGPNVEVVVNNSKQVVQVAVPELLPI